MQPSVVVALISTSGDGSPSDASEENMGHESLESAETLSEIQPTKFVGLQKGEYGARG